MALSELGTNGMTTSTSDVKNPYSEIINTFPPTEMLKYTYTDSGGNPVDVEYPKYLARKFSDHSTYYAFPEAAEGHVAYGTPGWTRQADVIRPFIPIMSVRDDTFTIRAYGEQESPSGAVHKAWCEAVVMRTGDYCDSTNKKTDYEDSPNNAIYPDAKELTEANKTFGRRYKIVSFRWLNEDEV